ncbi:hypothetical protein Tco_0584314 [Tanacetum coccineum]
MTSFSRLPIPDQLVPHLNLVPNHAILHSTRPLLPLVYIAASCLCVLGVGSTFLFMVFDDVMRFLLVGLQILLKDVEIKAMSLSISLSLGVSSSLLTTLISYPGGGEGALEISFPLFQIAAYDCVDDSKGL